MYEQALAHIGLSKEQSAIYAILVQNGPVPARDIHQKAPFSRPLVYKVLDELIALGLVDKDDRPGKIAVFSGAHPLKLKELAAKRLEQARDAQTAVEGVIGKLTSDFNLHSGKPGVQFYEGLSGIKAVLDDSLTAQEDILAYGDIEAIEKYIPDINRAYVQERVRRNVKKRGFALDTPFARNFLKDYAPGVTETKLLPSGAAPFHTVMQIYDEKVSYITLSEDNLIGVIIANRYIYEMHRELFGYLWQITPELSQMPRKTALGAAAEGNA